MLEVHQGHDALHGRGEMGVHLFQTVEQFLNLFILNHEFTDTQLVLPSQVKHALGRHVSLGQGDDNGAHLLQLFPFLGKIVVGVLQKTKQQGHQQQNRCRGHQNLVFESNAHKPERITEVKGLHCAFAQCNPLT